MSHEVIAFPPGGGKMPPPFDSAQGQLTGEGAGATVAPRTLIS